MSAFFVEAHVSDAALPVFKPVVKRAAERVTNEGRPVQFVRAIFVPGQETCIYLYRARSADAVRDAAEQAGLEIAQVSEAVLSHAA